ncbi:MAG: CubicO group peptidase (beta-lactamase class C family) [Brevundimonas sp.]|jgi:CubicO group peptidase (beta-lactamase class C family)|uniref:serine hydrolase domain-containing protein n=1 Tax=Brevundimonas sp. TaxID=1871086 RepID=UPI0039E23B7B
MRSHHILGLTAAILLSACAPEPDLIGQGLPRLERTSEVLFWSQDEREAGFRAMDRITPHRTVAAGGEVRALPPGAPLDLEVDAFMETEKVAGLLVLQDGRVRLERYGLGFGPDGRWTSFSVAKSLTSTLVGAAIADDHIESLQTPITRYLPELAGGAYDGVTVRQLLTMTSGVAWNEDYGDPDSDVARFFEPRETGGMDPTLHYMRGLTRAAEPGTRWHYSTGETNLVGLLISRATGRTLADYLSQTIWRPYGMERDAAWMVDEAGQEPGGCCLTASLRDWGRVGQLVLEDGVIDGDSIVPAGWFAEATRKQADIDDPGRGYGFQWWTRDDGRFEAYGIFGQTIHIDPERRLVVVILSAWPTATGRERSQAREAILARIAAAADQ